MILGLTGAFGGGKSTVLHYFEEKGWYTFDADAACHKLYDAAIPELIDKVKELIKRDKEREKARKEAERKRKKKK